MLAKDSTLATVRSTLSDAKGFVRAAYNTMLKRQKSEGKILMLRLGITGDGVEPNYRLEAVGGEPIVAINGQNHSDWPEGSNFDGANTWSSAVMTLEEVEALLRGLTGYKGPSPTA